MSDDMSYRVMLEVRLEGDDTTWKRVAEALAAEVRKLEIQTGRKTVRVVQAEVGPLAWITWPQPPEPAPQPSLIARVWRAFRV